MKNRYVEGKILIKILFFNNFVFDLVVRATNYEYNFFVKQKGVVSWHEPVIRMNGLPYSCTMADVQNFFKGIYIYLKKQTIDFSFQINVYI
jgi:hypothetical protein